MTGGTAIPTDVRVIFDWQTLQTYSGARLGGPYKFGRTMTGWEGFKVLAQRNSASRSIGKGSTAGERVIFENGNNPEMEFPNSYPNGTHPSVI